TVVGAPGRWGDQGRGVEAGRGDRRAERCRADGRPHRGFAPGGNRRRARGDQTAGGGGDLPEPGRPGAKFSGAGVPRDHRGRSVSMLRAEARKLGRRKLYPAMVAVLGVFTLLAAFFTLLFEQLFPDMAAGLQT